MARTVQNTLSGYEERKQGGNTKELLIIRVTEGKNGQDSHLFPFESHIKRHACLYSGPLAHFTSSLLSFCS